VNEASGVGWPVAFVAGLFSFLSPCVAPIVPGYLSFVSGVAVGPSASQPRQTERVVIASGLFVLGFSLVFVALGATAGAIGTALAAHREALTRLSGVGMILMGLLVLGLVRAPALMRERRVQLIDRPYGPLGAVVLGMAFGFGWTPCIGPVLASILLYAASVETAQEGALLLLMYSAGLGSPFLLTALGMSRALSSLASLRPRLAFVSAVSGLLLVGMGVLFLTNRSVYLTYLNVATQRLIEAAVR
jgi:cytochrome c-type biogenesis protein